MAFQHFEALARIGAEIPRFTTTHRGILLALAIYASRDGYAWPSVSTLVSLLGCHRRQVQRALRDLETEGLIVQEAQGRGRNHPSRYRLCGYIRRVADDPTQARTTPKTDDSQENAAHAPPFTEKAAPRAEKAAPTSRKGGAGATRKHESKKASTRARGNGDASVRVSAQPPRNGQRWPSDPLLRRPIAEELYASAFQAFHALESLGLVPSPDYTASALSEACSSADLDTLETLRAKLQLQLDSLPSQ